MVHFMRASARDRNHSCSPGAPANQPTRRRDNRSHDVDLLTFDEIVLEVMNKEVSRHVVQFVESPRARRARALAAARRTYM
ncbi:hypothetical protein [Sorangium sp. So ce693]|uniref:hypothetical protein n=1 Tax=Sorangium sp. So ce693 TaxID=3133318 RepID=UPI003F621F69